MGRRKGALWPGNGTQQKQIIGDLRQTEILISEGKTIIEAARHLAVGTLFIESGSPWENGYIESFNGKLRDELHSREIFTTLEEAKVLTEGWRREYNQLRPHSALGYKPPAPGPLIAATS